MSEDYGLDAEPEEIRDIIRPVFYGFTVLAAATLLASLGRSSGTLVTLSVLLAVSYVSAGFAELLEDKWSSLLKAVAVAGLLLAVLFSAFLPALF